MFHPKQPLLITPYCVGMFFGGSLQRQQGIEPGPSCREATVLITATYKCVGNITLDVCACAFVCVHAFAWVDLCLSGVINATLSPSLATILDAQSKDCSFVFFYDYYHVIARSLTHTHATATVLQFSWILISYGSCGSASQRPC